MINLLLSNYSPQFYKFCRVAHIPPILGTANRPPRGIGKPSHQLQPSPTGVAYLKHEMDEVKDVLEDRVDTSVVKRRYVRGVYASTAVTFNFGLSSSEARLVFGDKYSLGSPSLAIHPTVWYV